MALAIKQVKYCEFGNIIGAKKEYILNLQCHPRCYTLNLVCSYTCIRFVEQILLQHNAIRITY